MEGGAIHSDSQQRRDRVLRQHVAAALSQVNMCVRIKSQAHLHSSVLLAVIIMSRQRVEIEAQRRQMTYCWVQSVWLFCNQPVF